jgi:uncharacterized protein (DUF3084 family)
MTDKTKNPASDMFDEGLKKYEQALRTGLRFQEEAGRWWTRMLNQAASPQDFQKQVQSLATDFIPATRKSLDDCLELIEQNSRASVDLLKKSLEIPQSNSYAETHAKVTDFCESSLKSLKANAQAIVDINVKATDAWFAFVKKATAGMPEAKAEKA